jgi:hypothetical protein
MTSEQHSGDVFLRLVQSFTPDSKPDLVVLTGGEPLLRPKLVLDIAERVHEVGGRVVLASGMFFALQSRVPPAIDRAIAAADHFTCSLDVFHEEQVPRKAVFRAVTSVVERGTDASFLVAGMDGEDPYLADVIGDIRSAFDDRVPILVGFVTAVGRAAAWMPPPEENLKTEVEPMPCDVAAWPVVSSNGTVVGCCNQSVVDGPAPAHLRLGQAGIDTWSSLADRHANRPLMRAIRVFGPEYIAGAYGAGAVRCDGYCKTCMRLSDHPRIGEQVEAVMAKPAMRFFEQYVESLQRESFLYRHAPAGYESLVKLGLEATAVPAVPVA